MMPPRQGKRNLPDPDDNAVVESLAIDLGEVVEYDEALSEDAEERYRERLDDYAEAHAEAEAGLQDLPAG
jgi:hypothetical protein